MKTLQQFILENQQHTSATTSLNQISAGLKYAVKNNLIKPNSINVDNGGGKYDLGKNHVESNISGSTLHVHDPFNRSEEHNNSVTKQTKNSSDYVGLHNVLNVINEPEERIKALEKVKSFMKPKDGIAHITVYEGDKTGKGRISKADKGCGSSWQEHRPTSSYIPEIKKVFPDDTHEITHKSGQIIVKQK